MPTKKIIIKVGTNAISDEQGQLHFETIDSVAAQILQLRERGYHCILITSGAIACGMQMLGLTERPADPVKRQVCAAVGQTRLIKTWQKAFGEVRVSQHLVTHELFNCSQKTQDFRNCLLASLDCGLVPLINENDAVATEEIDQKFSDNDGLAALVAVDIRADRLILLSQVKGLFKTENGELTEQIRRVDKIDEKILNLAQAGSSTSLGRGGMQTKLMAIKKATEAGIETFLVSSQTPNSISQTFQEDFAGTAFTAQEVFDQPKIGIIGAGNMGGSIFRALQKHFEPQNLFLADKDETKLAQFDTKNKTSDLEKLLDNVEVVLIAIKPQDFADFCRQSPGKLANKTVLSIMAGVGLEKMQSLTQAAKVVRAMPNLGASVETCLTGWVPAWRMSGAERHIIETVFESFGRQVQLESENQLDLITGLSGSGVAYYFFLAEIFEQAGIEYGFSTEESNLIARETLQAVAKLIKANPKNGFETWRQMISSKGGTTEAAMNYLQDQNWPQKVKEAIQKSVDRSRELGG